MGTEQMPSASFGYAIARLIGRVKDDPTVLRCMTLADVLDAVRSPGLEHGGELPELAVAFINERLARLRAERRQ